MLAFIVLPIYNFNMDFVAIDFETANYSRESACSVGLVKFSGGEKVDEFYSLVRPPRLYVRPDFTDIHHLTADDLRDAPKFFEVWQNGAKDFIGSLPLVAHNAGFDMGVLKATLSHYEIDVPQYRYFDSLEVSRKVWRHLEHHALTALGKYFAIEYDAHNALSDAETCAKIIMLAAEQLCGDGKLSKEKMDLPDVRPFLKAANSKLRKLDA